MKIIQDLDLFCVYYVGHHTDHNESPSTGLSASMKTAIKSQIAIKPQITAAELVRKLHQTLGLSVARRQVQVFLRQLNRDSNSDYTMGQIRELVARPRVSYNYDESDLSISEFFLVDDLRFQIFITTKHLIKNAKDCSFFFMDFSHNISSEGTKIGILSSHDSRRRIFPIGFLLSKSEKMSDYSLLIRQVKSTYEQVTQLEFPLISHVLADGALGVTTMLNNSPLSSAARRSCWYHVNQSIDRFRYNQHTNRILIKSDLHVIHGSISLASFRHAWQQFEDKWCASEEAFVNLFRRSYIDTQENQNWLRCLTPQHQSETRICSTNICESLNSLVKRSLRAEQQLKQPLHKVLELLLNEHVPSLSKQVSQLQLHHGNILQKDVWEGVVNMKLANPRYQGTTNIFAIVDLFNFKILEVRDTNPYLQIVQPRYFEIAKLQCVVTIPQGESWRAGACSCAPFAKQGHCSHVVGFALLRNAPFAMNDSDSCPRELLNRMHAPVRVGRRRLV